MVEESAATITLLNRHFSQSNDILFGSLNNPLYHSDYAPHFLSHHRGVRKQEISSEKVRDASECIAVLLADTQHTMMRYKLLEKETVESSFAPTLREENL